MAASYLDVVDDGLPNGLLWRGVVMSLLSTRDHKPGQRAGIRHRRCHGALGDPLRRRNRDLLRRRESLHETTTYTPNYYLG